MNNQDQSSNPVVSTTSVQSIDTQDKLTAWFVDHFIDFDFEYFKTVMEPEELECYKKCVFENTEVFFKSLTR